MTFDQYVAAFVLGKVLRSDLPLAATRALEEGYDSVDLAVLAGSTTVERSPTELEELWRRGLRQLDKPLPGRAEAGRTLRNHYATLVASGSLAPRAGAAEIVWLAREVEDVLPSREYAGDGLGVAKLLGLYYSHDDVPFGDEQAHREIDAKIRAECRRLESEAS
jgi:hypothetical protein